MNERIKELAEQCGQYSDYEGWIFDKEKFAELIIAECMKLNCKELSITAIERLIPLYEEHFGIDK